MPAMICQGPGCGVVFDAKRKRAMYHSRACAQRAHRAGKTGGDPVPAPEGVKAGSQEELPLELGRLAEYTERSLAEVGRLDTWAGQSALVLARRIDLGGAETGAALAAMIRTHAEAMDRALDEAAPDDPVAKAQARVRGVLDEVGAQRERNATAH